MKVHTRLRTAILLGAIVTACSNPLASGTRAPAAPEVPTTRSDSVPDIPLPRETPLKVETAPAQKPESPSTASIRRAVVPVGTFIPVRTIEPIDSRKDPDGQTYRAVIDADITIANVAVIPKGSDARLKLAHVFSGDDFNEGRTVQIELDRIVVGLKEYTVSSGFLKADASVSTQGDVAFVGLAAITGLEQRIVPRGAQLSFRLEQPLEIEIGEPYSNSIPLRNLSSQSGPRKLGEHAAPPTTDTENAFNVSGEWNLLLENHRGARTLKLWLKQDGSILEGTIFDPTAGDLRLNGSISGQSVRFSTERGIQGGTERSEYRGTTWSSRLAGTVVVRQTPRAISPKRESVPQRSSPTERSYTWSARRVEE